MGKKITEVKNSYSFRHLKYMCPLIFMKPCEIITFILIVPELAAQGSEMTFPGPHTQDRQDLRLNFGQESAQAT